MNTAQPIEESGSGPRRIWLKRLGLLIGAVLLAGAIITVGRHRDDLSAALEAVRHPSWPHVAVLLGCVLMNVVLSGLLFSLLIARYGRVGLLEMQGLIASATLINFLPLRPGLFGRIAYHRTVNGIPATDSARTVIQALLCTITVAGFFAAVLAVSSALSWNIWIGGLLPVPLVAFGAARPAWRLAVLAFGVRYLEVLIWSLRYWASFALIGIAIDAQTALALACISVIATMVPFFSNGLGLREWAIGLAAPFLAAQVTQMQIGLTAELVNRAGELIVITIAGLIGMAYLAGRRRAQTD